MTEEENFTLKSIEYGKKYAQDQALKGVILIFLGVLPLLFWNTFGLIAYFLIPPMLGYIAWGVKKIYNYWSECEHIHYLQTVLRKESNAGENTRCLQ